MNTNRKMSRKDFLKGVGVSVAGVAMAGTLGGVLTGCEAKPTASANSDAPAYPFKYKKIDPAVAEERAYNTYFEQGG